MASLQRGVGVALAALLLLGLAPARGEALDAVQNFAAGFELLKAAKPGEAAAKFELGLKADPRNALGHFYLAEAYLAQSLPARAKPHYWKSLELDPASDVAPLALQRLAHISTADPATASARTEANASVPALAGKTIKDCDTCPEMVVIPPGKFIMGSPAGEAGRSEDEGPTRIVTISRAFALGRTQVTQGQWKAVMDANPSNFGDCGDDCPVENVSWSDAQEFIRRLGAVTGKEYRLPSEAEWEYACRGGAQQLFCGSDDAFEVAWHRDNSEGKTHPVGAKKANAFGLQDMSGNVWQWVMDCYHGTYGFGPATGDAWTGADCSTRVLRGGSWYDQPQGARAAARSSSTPEDRYIANGVRIARVLPDNPGP
jgi:formylglycine-generating enzyme required for sulfatase activity